MDTKVNDYFDVREFVPRETFNTYKDSILGSFINMNIVNGITVIRKRLGKPVIINTWHLGGILQYRGFRPQDCSEGSRFSQHKYANAIDFDIPGLHSLEVQAWIKKPENWEILKQFFTTMEEGTEGWVHMDNRYVPLKIHANGPFMVPIPKKKG